MKTGYMAGSTLVKGKMHFSFSFEDGKAFAQSLGKDWFVLPANILYDSEAPDEKGGYVCGFLKEMAGDRACRAYKIPWYIIDKACRAEFNGSDLHGQDNVARRREIMKSLASHPMVEFAWEDGGTLGVVLVNRTKEEIGWGYFANKNLGIQFGSGGKVTKRMTQLVRKFLGGTFKLKEAKFRIIRASTKEKVLDGAIMLPMYIKDEWIKSLKGVSKETLERMKECMTFNCRIFLPAGLVEEFPHGCLVKGQGFFSEHIHEITFHVCNGKKEVRVREDQPIRIGLVPQEGKFKSFTNAQYMIEQMHLFTPEEVMKWTDKTFTEFKENFESRKMEIDLVRMESKIAAGRLEEESHYVSVSRKLGEFLSVTQDISSCPPGLVKEYLQSRGMSAVDAERGDVRVKIPYATHCQVVSWELMDELNGGGYAPIQDGEIRYDREYNVYVVNNKDYEESIQVNHGGSDLDDFYDQIFRMIGDQVYVICLRCPNGWGEWSGWKYEAGDLPDLKWKVKDIPDLPKKYQWCKPRSLTPQVESGLIPGIKISWEKCYSYWDFEKAIQATNGNPGGIINKVVGLDLMTRRDKDYKIVDDESRKFSMEQVVDAYTQCDNPKNLEILKSFEDEVSIQLLAYAMSGNPVDNVYANGRKLFALLNQDQQERIRYENGWYSKVIHHAIEKRKEWNEYVEKKVKEVFKVPQGLLHLKENKKMEMKAKWFEDGWYGRMLNGEKYNGNTTCAGWNTITKLRQEFVSNFDVPIKELVPYIMHRVYVNPTARTRTDERMAYDHLVLKAWAEWVIENRGERITDHEWDCVPMM